MVTFSQFTVSDSDLRSPTSTTLDARSDFHNSGRVECSSVLAPQGKLTTLVVYTILLPQLQHHLSRHFRQKRHRINYVNVPNKRKYKE
jgi:hypothetical protein